MLETSVLFITYSQIQQTLRNVSGMRHDADLSMPQLCTAGAISGAAVSFVLTPVELAKCQLQVNHGNTRHHNGPFSLLAHTLKTKGITGLYKGHWGTLMREIAGGAAWFGVYELAIQQMLSKTPKLKKEDLSAYHLMTAGALAGMSYNAALFPADVIKSRQQVSMDNAKFTHVAKELYRAEGLRGFYRGFGITIARSAPTSAIIFLVYENLTRHLTVR